MDSERVERLIDLAAGDVAGAEADRIRESLSSDPEARRLVELFRTAGRILAADDSEAVPASLRRRLNAIPRNVKMEHAVETVRETVMRVAFLVFDGRRPALGVRSSVDTDARQLGYEAGPTRIDLQIEAADDDGGHLVLGHLVGARDRFASVRVVSADGDEAARSPIGERGFFEVLLPAGQFDFFIEGADEPLRVPNVPIGT